LNEPTPNPGRSTNGEHQPDEGRVSLRSNQESSCGAVSGENQISQSRNQLTGGQLALHRCPPAFFGGERNGNVTDRLELLDEG